MARRAGGRCGELSVFGSSVVPTGFGIAGGSVVVVFAALLAGALPSSASVARLNLFSVVVAGFAACPLTAFAVTGTSALAFLVFDGFLVNSFGQLSWHGAVDGWRLLTLAVAVAVGFATGVVYRAAERRRRWRRELFWMTSSGWEGDGSDDEPLIAVETALRTRRMS
ncbi:MAG: hypothetical protein JOY78_15955 [Pseudonocardia sp.]|nr:hypothetical protein [Pseudonocardia sp.]